MSSSNTEVPPSERELEAAFLSKDIQALSALARSVRHNYSWRARICHLVGALLAEAEAYEDAARWWREAVELNPGHGLARIQLALLMLTLGRRDLAADALSGYISSEAEPAIALFVRGLSALAAGDASSAERLLAGGLAMRCGNRALDLDMQTVLRALSGRVGNGSGAALRQERADGAVTMDWAISAYASIKPVQ